MVLLKLNYTFTEILKVNALPGFSEHHTGNAIDIMNKSNNFIYDNTKEYKWLIKNANKFGFFLSYPKNNDSVINFEPWHWYF